MNKTSLFIYSILFLYACDSVEEQNWQILNKTLKVTNENISGGGSKVKFGSGKFIALNQFSLEGQSLFIIGENEEILKKELIKPNTRTVIGGISEDVFLFDDYFYLIKDNGLFVKYSYAGEEIEKVSMKHVFPEKTNVKPST